MTRSNVSVQHLGRGDARDAAADDHRGAAPASAHLGEVESRVVAPGPGSRRRAAPLGTNFS